MRACDAGAGIDRVCKTISTAKRNTRAKNTPMGLTWDASKPNTDAMPSAIWYLVMGCVEGAL